MSKETRKYYVLSEDRAIARKFEFIKHHTFKDADCSKICAYVHNSDKAEAKKALDKFRVSYEEAKEIVSRKGK